MHSFWAWTLTIATYPFALNLISGFELEHAGQPLEVPGQKSRALICVLALHVDKTVPRSFLSDLLWDGMPDEQKAVNLRQTLSVVKRALGEQFQNLFEITRQTIKLRKEIVSIDVLSPEKVDATAPKQLNLFGHMGVKTRGFEAWLSDQQNIMINGTVSRTNRALAQAIDQSRPDLILTFTSRLFELEPDMEHFARHAYASMLVLGQNHAAATFLKANAHLNLTDKAAETVEPTDAAIDDTPIILVGRFNCRPENRAASHIATALSEAVVGDLAESAWVRVLAPDLTNLSAPMFGLIPSQQTPPHWNYRLDGAIQSEPLSASIWLTNGRDQTIVWTEKFAADSVGTIADKIVARVTASIESVVLDAEDKRATHLRSTSGYWENLARARLLFWRASQNANQEAELLLDAMLADTPHDVRVLTLAAYAKLMNAWSGWEGSTASNLDQATRLSRRAIQSAPDDAWSLMTMATVLSARLDLVGAKRKLEQALAIRPHLAAARGELARVLVFSGKTKEGALLAAEALDSSPRDPHASLWSRTQALASWMDGHYDHAAQLAELAIEKRTNWYPNFLISAVANIGAGNINLAKEAIENARNIGNGELATETLRCGHPFEDRLVFDRFMLHLKAAGWGES